MTDMLTSQTVNMQNQRDDFLECPECGCPLVSTPCRGCEDNKQRDEKHKKWLGKVWGGAMARDRFTIESLIETPHNKKFIDAIRSWDPVNHNLYFHGPTGVGKSHMAVAAARIHWTETDPSPVVWKQSQISREMRARDGADNETKFIERLANQKVLIIDDIGTEKRTEFMDTTLYEIIEARDMTGKGGLIVTSNLNPVHLDRVLGSTRITSRLARIGQFYDLSKIPDQRLIR